MKYLVLFCALAFPAFAQVFGNIGAVAAVTVASIGTGFTAFTLKTPDTSISKTDYTGLRWGYSNNTQPTGENWVQWYVYDNGSSVPYLTVTFSVRRQAVIF